MDLEFYAYAEKPMKKADSVSLPTENLSNNSDISPELLAEFRKESARPVTRYIDLAEIRSTIDHAVKAKQ